MFTVLSILIVAWIVYSLVKSHTNMTNAYEQASGHRLNTRDAIKDNISTGAIPKTESTYKEVEDHKGHSFSTILNSILVFEDKSMNLLLYGKNIKPCLVKIPYSDIKHYYYEANQSGTGKDATNSLDFYITLKQGSIEISDSLLDRSHAVHYLHILESKTTKDQQVKPTYNHFIFKHPIMHGRFIDNLMKEPQTDADKQQRNEIQQQITQDETDTYKKTHYVSLGYLEKMVEKRLAKKRSRKHHIL